MRDKKIGIIGYGNMGSAIAERAKYKSLFEIIVFDKDKDKTAHCRGLVIADTISGLMNISHAIILAVKPQDTENVLKEMKGHLKGQLIITIAAGISTEYIENILGEVHVIRVMPNMPAQIGEGISCLCKGKFSDEEDLDLAGQLLRCVGQVLIMDEDNIDAATAVSGSGPAYFCHFIKDKVNADSKKEEFIQKLTESAMSIGFDKDTAMRLSEYTVEGTISMLKGLNLSCDEVIKRVTSKGGTTEAALRVLNSGGSLVNAVKEALKRARELSRR